MNDQRADSKELRDEALSNYHFADITQEHRLNHASRIPVAHHDPIPREFVVHPVPQDCGAGNQDPGPDHPHLPPTQTKSMKHRRTDGGESAHEVEPTELRPGGKRLPDHW